MSDATCYLTFGGLHRGWDFGDTIRSPAPALSPPPPTSPSPAAFTPRERRERAFAKAGAICHLPV